MSLETPSQDDKLQPRSLAHHSARGAAAMLGVQLSKIVLLFISQLILARLLTPGEFGLVAMVAPIWAFVMIFADIGLAQAIVQRAEVTERQLSALFWIISALTLFLSFIMALTAPLLGWLYKEPRVVWIAVSLASLILLTGLSTVPRALLSRKMKFGLLAMIDLASTAIGIIVGVALAYLSFSYWALICSQAANAIANLVLSWVFSKWKPKTIFWDTEIQLMLHFGVNVSGTRLATYLTGSIDNILVGAVIGNVALGLYDRGYRLIVQPLNQLIFPFGQITVPLLSRLLTLGDSYRNSYLMATQLMMLITSPGLIFGALMPGPVVALLLGPRWSAAELVIGWFCFGALASPLYSTVAWLFITQDRTREQLVYTWLTSAINILSIIAGLSWGVVGVASCGALSYVFVQTPLLCWAATRKGPLNIDSLVRAILPYVIATIVTFLVLGAEKTAFRAPHIGVLFLMLSSCYLSTTIMLFCFPRSRHFLFAIWNLRSAIFKPQSLIQPQE